MNTHVLCVRPWPWSWSWSFSPSLRKLGGLLRRLRLAPGAAADARRGPDSEDGWPESEAVRCVTVLPASVRNAFPSCVPLPCNPAAEAALHPLIWCSESLSSQGSSFSEECFFSQSADQSLNLCALCRLRANSYILYG